MSHLFCKNYLGFFLIISGELKSSEVFHNMKFISTKASFKLMIFILRTYQLSERNAFNSYFKILFLNFLLEREVTNTETHFVFEF